jgi:hypothetical protein
VTLKVETAKTSGSEPPDPILEKIKLLVVPIINEMVAPVFERIEALEHRACSEMSQSDRINQCLPYDQISQSNQTVNECTLPKGSSFERLRLSRAGEVHHAYANKKMRITISKAVARKDGKDLWEMILSAIDAGLLTQSDANPNCKDNKLSIKAVLFPWLPRGHAYLRQYNLFNARDREIVRNEILPVAIQHKNEVMENPDRLEGLVNHERKRRQQAALAEKSLALLKPGEFRVVMYGEQLWPRLNEKIGAYDYEQLGIAVATFRDLVNRFQGDSNSIAIHIRDSIKWLRFYITKTLGHTNDHCLKIRRVFQLITHLSILLGSNPEGECRLPPTPVIEEQ